MKNEALELVKPEPNHMSSFRTLVVIANSASDEACSLFRKTSHRKNFMGDSRMERRCDSRSSICRSRKAPASWHATAPPSAFANRLRRMPPTRFATSRFKLSMAQAARQVATTLRPPLGRYRPTLLYIEEFLHECHAGSAHRRGYPRRGLYLLRRLACKQWGVNADRVTPAHEFEDGVDYVPAKPYVVLGHHFSSIAGAGPINGPIQAAVFGWVPVLLWVLIGGIFFGAMHDFGALFASLRHKGQTLASVIQKTSTTPQRSCSASSRTSR